MSLAKYLSVIAIITWVGASAGQSPSGRAGNFDGPAELPRVYMHSAVSDTPSPGRSTLVKRGDDLQRAIDKASCGETLRLEAGAQWLGVIHLPAKPCDDQHWITLRSSAEDAALSAEGKRLTPCYAGVASLPGRPEYACGALRNVLAKLVMDQSGTGPILFQDGANHYRLIDLEITRSSPGKIVYNLIAAEKDKAYSYVVLDRVWVHGSAQDETTRGLMLTGADHVAVVDSYFSDFHCVALTGACVDSQAIAGGLGDRPSGVFKIVNNFLEASGQSLLFGGGEATQTPADIEIRHNHLFKPLTWQAGAPGFVGGDSGRPFIVKNLFELKNAERVLVEGNLMENVWGGFTQAGFAILLTPKNQNNHCPICKVDDVTLRFNRVKRMASGIQIASGLSDAGAASAGAARISIHDSLFDEMDGTAYRGLGVFAQISSNVPSLRDISIVHNTAFPPKALLIVGGKPNAERMSNFIFSGNLMTLGDTDIISTGGGPQNCAFKPVVQGPTGVLKSCFTTYKVEGNVFAGSKGKWPENNLMPSEAGLADFREGRGGDYRLCRDKADPHPNCKKPSPGLHAAPEGRDAGADLEALKSATEAVE